MDKSIIIDTLISSDSVQSELIHMPIHRELIQIYREEVDFSGLKIGFSHVLAPNTIPMIIALLETGGSLDIIIDTGNNHDQNTIDLLKQSGINIIQAATQQYDYTIDCVGYFSKHPPKKGSVEVTRSGIHKYQNIEMSFPLIDVDSSICKIIETSIGNPIAVINTIEKYLGDANAYLKDKRVAVIGFGKIGRGLTRKLNEYTEVIVLDISEEALDLAASLGFHTGLISENMDTNNMILAGIDIIFTATGHEGVMTQYFSKIKLDTALKINLGAEDEWGSDYSEDDVFMSKHKPFNFNLIPPTSSKYIDPILALHLEGLHYVVENSLVIKPGYNKIPKSIDIQIADKFNLYHPGELDAIKEYFPKM